MKKNHYKLLTVLWILAATGSRILYLIFQNHTVNDVFGYFSDSMIQASEKEPILVSGLSYAYTQNLEQILLFLGNTMKVIPVCNLVMQILWLILLFLGISMLFGKTAGLVCGSMMAVYPWVIDTMFTVSPENYYMLRFCLLLFLAACFYQRTRMAGWYRSSACELLLAVLGFGLGVITVWSYMSWLLFPVLVYILIRNRRVIEEKSWLIDKDVQLSEKDQLMPVATQSIILLLGIFLGMFATLMKYTGLTGYNIFEQINWWMGQYKNLPWMNQNIPVSVFAGWIASAFAGIAIQLSVLKITEARLRKKTLQAAAAETMPQTQTEEPKAEEKEEIKAEVKNKTENKAEVKEEPKKKPVKYLKNPLPVPRKHISKKMDFDLKDISKDGKNDFDRKTETDDDFDIK